MGTSVLSPQAKGVTIRMVLNVYMSPKRCNFSGITVEKRKKNVSKISQEIWVDLDHLVIVS